MNFVNVFLNLHGMMASMKKIYIAVAALALMSGCSSEHKNPSILGVIPPMEWPSDHWEGQNYAPTISNRLEALPDAVNEKNSIFANVGDMTPDEFVAHLKQSRIISRVYTEKALTMQGQKETGTYIVDLDENFYVLSSADQQLIGKLIARSYEKETYVLKDSRTQRTVGQITPSGLDLF